MKFIDNLNAKVADSPFGRYFKIKERNTSFVTELRGGTVSFLTCAYILAVNASIIADTGGPCVESDGACPLGPGSLGDLACQQCVADVKKSLISATAAICVISHFLMAVLANMPLAICPGMGLNAYFAYTVVGFMGTGQVAYKTALAAVFVEGFIFVALALLGVRSKLIELIPRSVMLSTSAGIGLFLAFIGLQSSEGLGVVTYDAATLVTLGGCTNEFAQHMYTIPNSAVESNALCELVNGTATVNSLVLGTPSSNRYCEPAGKMRAATLWLGISGGMLMSILMAKGVKGAIMAGISMVTIISWIPTASNKATYLGVHSSIPGGEARLDYFKKVVAAPDTSATAGKLSFVGFGDGDLWIALITFLYVDFLDCTGTMYSMANFLSLYIPGFIDQKTRKFERQLQAFCVDGITISIGALLGVSPVTVYVESASGIREGARTGVAALTIGFFFFVSLFFTPLLASIPPYATGPALILVGSMMIINIVKIKWDRVQEAVPAFITMVVMPLTYSIAYGVIAGVISYIWINGFLMIINYIQLHLFGYPAGHSKEDGKWRVVRQMTFAVHDAPTDDDIKDASIHGHLHGHDLPPTLEKKNSSDEHSNDDSVGKA